MLEGFFVPLALLRFDPAPFDRNSEGAVVKTPGEGDIFFKTSVMITGKARFFFDAACFLPGPPIVEAIIPFGLMGTDRTAPQEIFWKKKCLRPHVTNSVATYMEGSIRKPGNVHVTWLSVVVKRS